MRKDGSNDLSVQATNDDATVSKLSCARAGYVKDDFVHLFVRRPLRRSPVINRGYYARWAGMRLLLEQFLEGPSQPRQILSLGAGFDTLFFQLQAEGRAPERFYEVDFAEVTARKASAIASHDELRSKLEPTAKIAKGGVHSANYGLVAGDLRDLNGLDAALKAAGLDPKLPTLILAECVLIYMDPPSSRALIQWAAKKFSTSAFVIYEQIQPDDAFGQQMVRNLESRGCPLLGIWDTPSLEDKEKRFTDLGFQRAGSLDMDAIYTRALEVTDIRRIERLEIFDEFEEWHIMQEHYCIAFGVNDELGVLSEFGFQKYLHEPTSPSSPGLRNVASPFRM